MASFLSPPSFCRHERTACVKALRSSARAKHAGGAGSDWQVTDRRAGLTSALLQLDAVAHMDVVDSDVASCGVIEESFKHHLNTRHGEVKAAASRLLISV